METSGASNAGVDDPRQHEQIIEFPLEGTYTPMPHDGFTHTSDPVNDAVVSEDEPGGDAELEPVPGAQDSEEPRQDRRSDAPAGPPGPPEGPTPPSSEFPEEPEDPYEYGAGIEMQALAAGGEVFVNRAGGEESAVSEVLGVLERGEVESWLSVPRLHEPGTTEFINDPLEPTLVAVARDMREDMALGSHEVDMAAPLRGVINSPGMQTVAAANEFTGLSGNEPLVVTQEPGRQEPGQPPRVLQTTVYRFPDGRIAEGADDYSGDFPVVTGSELNAVVNVVRELQKHAAVNGIELDVLPTDLRITDNNELVYAGDYAALSTFDQPDPTLASDEIRHFGDPQETGEYQWIAGGLLEQMDLSETALEYDISAAEGAVAREAADNPDVNINFVAHVEENQEVVTFVNPATGEYAAVNVPRDLEEWTDLLTAIPRQVAALRGHGVLVTIVGTDAGEVTAEQGFTYAQRLDVLLRAGEDNDGVNLGITQIDRIYAEAGSEVRVGGPRLSVEVFPELADEPSYSYDAPRPVRRTR